MADFQNELHDFKQSVDAIRAELADTLEFMEDSDVEDFLYRIMDKISNFAYLVEGADAMQLEFINKDWPSEAVAELHRDFHMLIGKVPGEFRKIFKSELAELMTRIRFYVKLPDHKPAPAGGQAATTSEKIQSKPAAQRYEAILKAEPKTQKGLLFDHLKTWALSVYCEQMLFMLISQVKSCRADKDDLCVTFENDANKIEVRFGPPYAGHFDEADLTLPASYKAAVATHNEVSASFFNFRGYAHGLRCRFDAPDAEVNTARYRAFCELQHGAVIWDMTQKNALGEPLMKWHMNGKPVAKAQALPTQKTVAYGTGGLLLRLMGAHLFSEGLLFKPFYL